MQSIDIRLTENDIKEIEEAIPENEIAGASFPNRKFRDGKAISFIKRVFKKDAVPLR